MGKLLPKNLDFYIKTWYNVGMKNLRRAEMVFKRKIYDRFLEWKENWAGKRALLVQGARRIGKSTIVEEFAKNEYETYILINFQSDLGKVEQLLRTTFPISILFFEIYRCYTEKG